MDGPRDDHAKCSKSERERQTPHGITYIRNLKYDPDGLICETDSGTQKTELCLPKGWEWEREGLELGQQMQTAIDRTD